MDASTSGPAPEHVPRKTGSPELSAHTAPLTWPPVTFAERFGALVSVRPIAVQAALDSHAPPQANAAVILRWNYERLFAYLWAGVFFFMALRNAPWQGTPPTLDVSFLLAGLLYVVWVFLSLVRNPGGYVRSFAKTTSVPGLPINRLGLLAWSAVIGLVQCLAAAVVVGGLYLVLGRNMAR